MINQAKKVLFQIEKLSRQKQEEIVRLIENELAWETAFEQSQEQLSILAQEALKEYQAGKTICQAY